MSIADHVCDWCGRPAATIEPTNLAYTFVCKNDACFLALSRATASNSSAVTGLKMKTNGVYPSKWLRSDDLVKPVTLEIEGARMETLKTPDGKSEDKLVVRFTGVQKALVVNKTNLAALDEICGSETDDWPGKVVELFPTKTNMAGKTVPCIRIRQTTRDALNDSLPF
jgi:hypothetical protein